MNRTNTVLLVCGVILTLSGVANAAPFLVCDPDPNCETYNVYADDTFPYETFVLLQADAPAPLSYDLVFSPPGGIAYTAECCNVEGCSDPSDPYISLGVPGSPQSLRISIQPSP